MIFLNKMKKIWGVVALCMFSLGIFPSAALSSEAAGRIDWQYRDNISGAHPGQVEILPNENVLFVLNGYTNTKVLEVNRDGKVEWSIEDIRANSASRMSSGNTLISETSAPGKPGYPRVVEVTPGGQEVWEYRLPKTAQAPRYSYETDSGKILITTRNKVMLVNRSGELELTINMDHVGSNPVISQLPAYDAKSNGVDAGKVSNLVSARQLPSGNILIVDQGIRTGGRVVEVNSRGQFVQEWTDMQRAKAAMRLDNGGIAILDTGAYALLIYDQSGNMEDVISYRQVITELPVLNQWGVALQPESQNFIMGLTYTNGQSLLVEINDKVPKITIDGDDFAGTSPFMAGGRMFGPMREIFSSLGIDLHWDADSKEMVAVQEGTTVKFKTGSSKAEMNGKEIDLGAQPRMVGNQTYVPLRILDQCFGYKLTWDGENRTTNIGSN